MRVVNRRESGILGGLLLAVGALWAGPALSVPIAQIGGVDSETAYNGFDGVPAGQNGILTFDDAFNGFNDPEQGQVTTSAQVPALIGGKVYFEALLDTSAFVPATGDVRDAVFIGTGAGPEITILSPIDNTTVLLAFDIDFIEVTQGIPSGGLGGATGTIILGNPQESEYGITSQLQVAGGTLNALVGGVGTPAVMEMLMSALAPTMTKALRNAGYLNTDFTNGVGGSLEDTTWNITIIPEPSSAVLVGVALVGLVAIARRRVR